MRLLSNGSTPTIVLGPFLDDTDGKTAETGLTIAQADVRLSKNAGAFAQKNSATSATHMENGHYSVPLSATDTNTNGILTVAVLKSGALPVWVDYLVVPANVYNAICAETGQVRANIVQCGGNTVAAGAIPNAAAAASGGLPIIGTGSGAINPASGKMPATIAAGDLAANSLTASALAADAVNEIADGVWDEARSGHTTAGSYGEGVASVQGNVTGSVGSVTGAVGSVTGNVGGNVTGSVGSVTGAVGSVTGNVGGNVTGSVGSVASGGITAASIATGAIDADALAADAVDEIWSKAMTELAAVPGVTGTVLEALQWLFLLSRNKITQTNSTQTLRNNADGANIATASVSDDGTTFTRAKFT